MRLVMYTKSLLLVCLFAMIAGQAQGQEAPQEDHSYKPLTLKLSEDGKKYVRFITWHQVWATFRQDATTNDISTEFRLRRSRFLAFAQISPRFLILTHFGLNNLTASNMDPTGLSPQAQLFMHDAWAEFRVVDKYLYLGAGLHYWNGISRLTNQSTLNIMTLDAPRFNWATIGTSDQFARHLGVYAKGKIGGLDYRMSINESITNTLDVKAGITPGVDTATFDGAGGMNVSGYFNYQFLDKESNKLPYMVGTYIGKKKVFNIGAGFFTQPDGTVSLDEREEEVRNNVTLWSVDAFYDSPVGENGAVSAYLAYYNFDFGPNYQLTGGSETIASGNTIYGQVGYALPALKNGTRFMPYASYSNRMIEAADATANTLGVGINYFISGHNAKITGEFNSSQGTAGGDRSNFFRLQAMIFL